MNSLIVAFLLLLSFQWSVVSAQHYRIEKICLSDFQNAKIQKIRVFLEQHFYFFYPKCYRFRLKTYNIQYKNPLYALHVYIFIVRISVFNGGHKRTNLLHKNSYMFMVLLGHFIVIPVSMFNTPKTCWNSQKSDFTGDFCPFDPVNLDLHRIPRFIVCKKKFRKKLRNTHPNQVIRYLFSGFLVCLSTFIFYSLYLLRLLSAFPG